jgi:hypothetical protein
MNFIEYLMKPIAFVVSAVFIFLFPCPFPFERQVFATAD